MDSVGKIDMTASFFFENMWTGLSWENDASEADKKMFRDHVESLEMYETWKSETE
jgi:hypothetical protein